MSRSYKKTPISKDNPGGRKSSKKQANRRVRNSKNVPNGKQYRKFFNSYDIYDYISECSFEEYKKYQDAETEQELYGQWRKYYRNK